MINSEIGKIYIYRERLHPPYGTSRYADNEFILLMDNIMWIGSKKLYRESKERFIEVVKRDRKLSDITFLGDSTLKKNKKIEFEPLCPNNLPSNILIEYLKRAFCFSPGWYTTYCDSSVYYKGCFLGKIKDIVKVS